MIKALAPALDCLRCASPRGPLDVIGRDLNDIENTDLPLERSQLALSLSLQIIKALLQFGKKGSLHHVPGCAGLLPQNNQNIAPSLRSAPFGSSLRRSTIALP
jgi:hypothetical protein